MAAQKYQIIGSEVMRESKIPEDKVIFIVAMGKSTDIKPIQETYKFAMGSSCKEIDTGDTYYWDTESEEWIKQGGDE